MPIRINLLAEAQALEDLRRRDPVKRASWAGLLLVLLVLVWISSLQLKAMIARGGIESRPASAMKFRTVDELVNVITSTPRWSSRNPSGSGCAGRVR